MKKFLPLLILAFTLTGHSAALAQTVDYSASPVSGIVSDGFTIVPAYPNSVNGRKFMYDLRPGESYTDYVIVKNLSSEPSTYMLYGADPTLTNMGTDAYKTRDHGINAEGSWINFVEPEITLQGQEEKLIGFTINVPQDTPYGDYRAGITMEKTKKDSKNSNVTIATRVILHASIKVTDKPEIIPREQEPPQAEKATTWHPYYFWVTLILFVLSITGLLWTSSYEKKLRKDAEVTRLSRAAKTHATKPTEKARTKGTHTAKTKKSRVKRK